MSELEDRLGAILSNPDAMGQIMSIAQSLGGGDAVPSEQGPPAEEPPPSCEPAADPFSLFGALDPGMIQTAMGLFSAYQGGGDDRATALLAALRPYVKASRHAKMDKAIQIAKLSRVIRAGVDLFTRKEDADV